jgi:hypothetical protein
VIEASGRRAEKQSQLAVLTRELDMRVVNISLSGCLLELSGPIEIGTLATLRLIVGGEVYTDDVHVIRCKEVDEAVYHAGARFLWTTPPHRRSIRRIATNDFEVSECRLSRNTTH